MLRAWSHALLLLPLVTGCGGGTRDIGSNEAGEAGGVAASDAGADLSDASHAAATGLQASVAYPFLISDSHGSADYFPTVFAHLLGQTLGWTDISTSLACFTLKNSADAPIEATVRVDLVGYSTPLEQSVIVAPNSTSVPCINPTPALDALYGLASPIPGQVHATVRSQASTSPLLDDVHAITLATAQTVFEGKKSSSGQNVPLYDYQAVLSMPKDPMVQGLLAPAAQRSAWGTFGAGGYGMHLDVDRNPIPRNPVTTGIAAGGFQLEAAYFTAGESITLSVDEVACGSCAETTTEFYVLNQSAFEQFSSSPSELPQALLAAPAVAAGGEFTVTAPTGGSYYLVFTNHAADANLRNVTYHRTGTRSDTVIDALQSVYEQLQSLGITYDSVAFSFFDPTSTESVRWPATVLTERAANCIDGSILFASVLEALQLEPVIVFVPGHAYLGVRQAPGSPLLWPIETTMLGTAPFLNALFQGTGEYENAAIPHLAEMDIKAARLAGLVPIPE